MGTPELTPDIVTAAAIWAGVTVAALLTLWLVVRSAVRSEFRAERRRSALQDPVAQDSAARPPMHQVDDVSRGGVRLVATEPAAPPSPAATPPPANPYASPPPAFPSSLSHLPPPRSEAAIFAPASSPGIMSGRRSETPFAGVDDGAGVYVVDAAAASLTTPPPVVAEAIAMQPAAARHALEQLVAHAPEPLDPTRHAEPELRPRPYGRHS